MADDERRSRDQNDTEARPAVRELPHSVELERTVLAVLLDGRHATAIHTVREAIEHPLVFYVRDHRIIYQACLDLDDAGERIDAHAVAELLKGTDFQVVVDRLRRQQVLADNDQLDALGPAQRRALYKRRPEDAADAFADSALAAIGSYAAIIDIAGHYVSAAGLARNVAQLHDYYLKRRLIRHLTRISDKAYRTTETFSDLIDGSSQTVLELSRQANHDKRQVHDVAAVVDDTLLAISEQASNPAAGVTTGYREIDDMLMSLRPGGLYVLAARPGVGKTSFALSIVQHVCGDAESAHAAMFFSLEVDRVDLLKKLICAEADIEFKAMERGLIAEHEWEALHQAAERFRTWRLDLMDVSDLTVQGMRSVAKRHLLERPDLKIIVIDYLQLLGSARKDLSEYEKISEISRTLKILARELGMPVLALSQMSRESEKGGKPREPRLSDLRGSGSIEQDADAVLFLHRVNPEDEADVRTSGRDMKLIVAKNRFGPTGLQAMKFFPGKQRFITVSGNELAAGGGQQPAPDRHDRLEAAPTGDEDLFG